MTRRFVIAADKLTSEQDKELKDFLHEFGGYWHWIDNLWLLAVPGEEDVSAAKIRDKVRALNKDSRIMVLEVGADIDWAGSGKRGAKGKDQHDWFGKTWADKDDS